MKSNLEKYLFELRRIEEHRTAGVEKKIRKLYKKVLRKLKQEIADLYLNYSEDGILDYSMLYRAGIDARFLDEVDLQLNDICSQERQEIRKLVEDTYTHCYQGMADCVNSAAGDVETVKKSLASIRAVRPEIIAAAVNNPIHGLTLNERLERKRGNVIYNIKKHITVGLSNGDRFETIANRVAGEVEGDYKKAIRIVRTEAHRVREQGFHDSAEDIDKTLRNGNSGMVLTKTWRTMQDERVRPNRRYKTKKGWRTGRPGKYNHQKMDGVTIPINEEFALPSGARTKAPGQSGVAGEDINCRCYLSYALKRSQNVKENKATEPVAYSEKTAIMKLPKADNLTIPKEKFTKYALNPDKAPDKARAFKEALGYDLSNYKDLIESNRKHVSEYDAIPKPDNGHGTRYEVRLELTGPNGKKATVLTGWIDDRTNREMRMTTAYIDRRKKNED